MNCGVSKTSKLEIKCRTWTALAKLLTAEDSTAYGFKSATEQMADLADEVVAYALVVPGMYSDEVFDGWKNRVAGCIDGVGEVTPLSASELLKMAELADIWRQISPNDERNEVLIVLQEVN